MDTPTRLRFVRLALSCALIGSALWWIADIALVVLRSPTPHGTTPVLTTGWFTVQAEIAFHVGQHGVLVALWFLPVTLILWIVGER